MATVDHEIKKAYREGRDTNKAGEILVAAGLVDEEQVVNALRIQKKFKQMKLGQFLIAKGILQEEHVFSALAEKFRIPFIDLRQTPISRQALTTLPKEIILKLQVLPISQNPSHLVVATKEPDYFSIKSVLSKSVQTQNIQLVLTRPTLLQAAIKQLYKTGH